MTITVGSELVLSNITADAYDSAPLDSNAAIVVNGRDAEIISISGLIATENAKTEYSARVSYNSSRVIALDATNAVALVSSGSSLYASHLTISGTSISASALQDLSIYVGFWDISTLSSSTFLLTYNDNFSGGGYAVVVTVSGSTFTIGTSVQFTSTTTLGAMSCGAYGALQAVVSWAEASPGAGNACFLSITGTSVSVSTPKFVYDAGNIAYIAVEWLDSSKAITTYRLDSTGYTWASILQTTGGGTPFVFSATADVTATPSGVLDVASTEAIALTANATELNVSGSTITLGDVQSITGSTDPLSISKLSSTSALCVYDISATKVKVIQFTDTSASTTEKILSLSMPFFGGTEFWSTIWRSGVLYLQQRDTSTGLVLSELSLGSATEAQVTAKTYIAYVFAADADSIVVFGRMDSPQGLSSPTHVMYTNDSGASWTSTVSDWGSDVCGDLAVNRFGELIAIRVNASTGKSKVYTGSADALQFATDMDFDNGVEYGGLSIDSTTAAIVASGASEASSGIVIERLQRPYTTTHDITFGRSTAGIKRVDST